MGEGHGENCEAVVNSVGWPCKGQVALKVAVQDAHAGAPGGFAQINCLLAELPLCCSSRVNP